MQNLQPHEYANIFPMMNANDMRSLLEDMKANGYDKSAPIVLYEGKILDGRNRYAAANQLGIEPAFVEFEGGDPVLFAVRYNLNRRHLTDGQRAAVAAKLANLTRGDFHGNQHVVSANLQIPEFAELSVPTKPKISQADAADMLNVSERSVATVKAVEKAAPELVDKILAGEITPHAAYQQVKVSREEAAKMAGVSAKDMAKIDHIEKVAPELLPKLESGEMTLDKATKEVKAIERQEYRNELATIGMSVPTSEKWQVYHADLDSWNAPRQYDFIITDPPYPKEFLPLYEVLAMRANDWLKPNGLLIAMAGQSYLDEIHAMMSRHLEYYWTACYLTPGQPTPLRQVNVNTTWKPLLVYQRKGDKYGGKIFGDVFKSDGNDKENHKWGQSISGMYDIISKVCLQGQYILDPFCGAGSTGIAALKHNCFFDGIEIDEANVNISKGRLGDATN